MVKHVVKNIQMNLSRRMEMGLGEIEYIVNDIVKHMYFRRIIVEENEEDSESTNTRFIITIYKAEAHHPKPPVKAPTISKHHTRGLTLTHNGVFSLIR